MRQRRFDPFEQNAAGLRKEVDLPWLIASQVTRDDGNTLGLQKAQRKLDIALRYVAIALSDAKHMPPAEDLRFQLPAVSALTHTRVDQQLHGMNPIAGAGSLIGASRWKDEMVHTAHMGHRIAQTDGDAGAEDRTDNGRAAACVHASDVDRRERQPLP